MERKLTMTALEHDFEIWKNDFLVILEDSKKLIISFTRFIELKLFYYPGRGSRVEEFFEIKSYNIIENCKSYEKNLSRNGL